MPNFTHGAFGVVKNVDKENEEKFLFMAQDDEGNEYTFKEHEKFLLKSNGEEKSKIEEGEKFNEFCKDFLIYFSAQFMPKKENEI